MLDQDQSPSDALLHFLSLSALMEECIVRKSYVVPDALTRPIVLTEDGSKALREFRSGATRIKQNEAKLAVALAIGWEDEVFVSEETDIDALRTAISAEIGAGKILYPWIFDRDLHDYCLGKWPRLDKLPHTATMDLLTHCQGGVFQVGSFVVGPYGAFESRGIRQLQPSTEFPGFRCPDDACKAIHSIKLTTGDSAIQRARAKFSSFLAKRPSEGFSKRPLEIRRAYMQRMSTFEREPFSRVIDTLMDTSSTEELRAVCETAMRVLFKSKAERSAMQKRLGIVVASPRDYLDSLSRPQLLALLLYFRNEEIVSAIDACADDGAINVPSMAVRTSRISRFGDSPLECEIGKYGVRFKAASDVPHTPHLLAELIRALCEDDQVDNRDLAYGLSLREESDEQALVSAGYASEDVERTIDDVVLPSRLGVQVAVRHLNLDAYLNVDRTELRGRLLWKLGWGAQDGSSRGLGECREQLSLLRGAVRAGSLESEVRGLLANLFVPFETLLMSSLTFSTWAFLEDHWSDPNGFSYPWNVDGTLEKRLDVHGSHGRSSLWGSKEKPGLVAIASGFGRLAAVLEEVEASGLQRSAESMPFGPTALEGRPFAFAKTPTFCNLTSDARRSLVDSCRGVARMCANEDVVGSRNAGLHGNSDFPPSDMLERSMELLQGALEELMYSGMAASLYDRSASSVDSLGREKFVYVSPEGVKVEVPRGTWTYGRLPTGDPSLLIMPRAIVGELGPLRFKPLKYRGSPKFWEDWPTRWSFNAGFRLGAGQSDESSSPAELAG